VAVAVELMKSMLYNAKTTDGLASLKEALQQRFTPAQVQDAFSHLQGRGHIYSGAARRAYHLTDSFRQSLQVCIMRDHREILSPRRDLLWVELTIEVNDCNDCVK
jgi:hypothetical protein